MTLSSTTVKDSFSGDGSTTDFPTSWVFWNSSEIEVTLVSSSGNETVWTQDTEYSVTGGLGAAGTVAASTSPTDFTPATNETLVLKSNVLDIQETSLPAGGIFPSTSVEQEFDRTVRRIQQQAETIGRQLTYPISDASSLSAQLPNSTDRASKFLGFDSDGLPIASAGSADTVTVSTFMAGVLDDITAGAALTTLGISTFAKTFLDDTTAGAVRTTIGAAAEGGAGDPFDIPFNAGYDTAFAAADLAVQPYAEIVMSRSGSFTGEVGFLETVATDADAIVDIEKNGATIYSTKPKFDAAATSLTGGTLLTDGTEDFVSGDRITFKVTQIGSTIAGARMRFTAKAKLT